MERLSFPDQLQVIFAKQFSKSVLFLWYNSVFCLQQITLSPLFVMRSHLPEPLLMNVLTTKTNSTTVLPVQGRGEEQQIFGLVPNTWHHLTFQFNSAGQSSSPSLPLNTTLIELANRLEPDSTIEEQTDLKKLWPYCQKNLSVGCVFAGG